MVISTPLNPQGKHGRVTLLGSDVEIKQESQCRRKVIEGPEVTRRHLCRHLWTSHCISHDARAAGVLPGPQLS